MQPQLRHVPPRFSSFSIIATLIPSWLRPDRRYVARGSRYRLLRDQTVQPPRNPFQSILSTHPYTLLTRMLTAAPPRHHRCSGTQGNNASGVRRLSPGPPRRRILRDSPRPASRRPSGSSGVLRDGRARPLYSRTVVPRCSTPAARFSRIASKSVPHSACVRVFALRLGWRQASKRDFIDVDVPDTGDHFLIQEQRLYLGLPAAEQPWQISYLETAFQRLRSDRREPLPNLLLIQQPHPAKAGLVPQEQPPVPRPGAGPA